MTTMVRCWLLVVVGSMLFFQAACSVGVRSDPTARTVVTNRLGMEFVRLPAGTFSMGSPLSETGRDRDEDLHRVTLTRPFFMQTTEVTQAQWQAVMGDNPAHFDQCGPNCPVEMVSWFDVQRFIDKLNQMEKPTTYRLPTESEWEYAARAGTTTPLPNGPITQTDCRHDPTLDQIGWYCGNSGYRTHAVAVKEPNAWGLYDMHGNVWEWCQDWYGDYPRGEVSDPQGPADGWIRANRGGSVNDMARFCRSANRIRYMPFDHTNDLGFRLVMAHDRS